MPLQIRRGTEGQLSAVTLAQGEPAFTTDSQKFVVGDGFTPGGVYIGGGTTATFLNVNVINTLTADSVVLTGNLDGAEGYTANMTGFRAGWYGGTAGYAFKSDTDTGMFANGTGDLRFKIDGNNAVLVDSTGWDFQNNIWVTNTATVTTLKFGDGTEMITAATGGGADQSLNTTSSVRFELVNVGTGTTSVGTLFDNDSSMLLTADQGVYISAPYGLNIDSNTSAGNAGSRLFVNQIQVSGTATEITVNSLLNINNTLTVQAAFMGLNTGTNWRDFGYGNMPYNANNMKIELPNNGSSLFFAFKNPGGATRNIGFSRQGHIVLQQGGIFNASPNGVSLQANDGGQVFVGVNTNTNGVLYTSRLGANTSTGVFQTVQNNAGVNFSTLLDYTGLFTVPRDLSVATTATVNELSVTTSASAASLSVTNTATVNEVVVGPDLRAIKSISYNTIGVEGNWHVGNVLEVGTDDGNGYITSTGNNNLTLQTSGNNGPGGSIVVGYGDGAGVSLYSGNSQEFQTAQFNTTSNTINYGLTVNGVTTVNGNATFNVANTVTIAGMTIGLNNDAVVMPAATVASSATTVLFQTIPGAGGNIIFNMNRFGVQWPLAITRTGGVAFTHGQQIFPGQTTNVGALNVQAGSTSTGTANQLFLSSGGSGTGPLTRGVFNDGTGFTVGTRTSGGATAFNSFVFGLTGGLTLPVLTAAPSTPAAGMVAVNDGTTWDPHSDGLQHINCYLNGAWAKLD